MFRNLKRPHKEHAFECQFCHRIFYCHEKKENHSGECSAWFPHDNYRAGGRGFHYGERRNQKGGEDSRLLTTETRKRNVGYSNHFSSGLVSNIELFQYQQKYRKRKDMLVTNGSA